MTNLTRASRELFRRPPDERFEILPDLHRFCVEMRDRSQRYKGPSTEFRPLFLDGHLTLQVNGHAPLRMNDWSFTLGLKIERDVYGEPKPLSQCP